MRWTLSRPARKILPHSSQGWVIVIVYLCHHLFNHSPIGKHLHFIYFFKIIDNKATNILLYISLHTGTTISKVEILSLKVEFWGPQSKHTYISEKYWNCAPKRLYQLILPWSIQRCLFLNMLANTRGNQFFNIFVRPGGKWSLVVTLNTLLLLLVGICSF